MRPYTITFTKEGVYHILDVCGNPVFANKSQKYVLEMYNAKMLCHTTLINAPVERPTVQSFGDLHFVARSEHVYETYEILSPLFDNVDEAELFLETTICECRYFVTEHYVSGKPVCSSCLSVLLDCSPK